MERNLNTPEPIYSVESQLRTAIEEVERTRRYLRVADDDEQQALRSYVDAQTDLLLAMARFLLQKG